MNQDNRTVRIAVRTIYHMPVTPAMYVIDMKWETWREFLYATPTRRKQIVLKLIDRDNMAHKIREVVWIPLDNQEKLVVNDESIIIKEQ